MESLAASLATEEQKLLACIHCGLCLESCPTYVATGDENDSPRGRLYLMRAVGEGRLEVDSTSFERHIDRCLGCRACESVCPAGVEYGELLEASRSELFHSRPKRGFAYLALRMMLGHVWQQPWRLRLLFRVARFARDTRLPHLLIRTKLAGSVSTRLEFALALLESSAPPRVTNQKPASTPRRDPDKQSRALIFSGCVTEGLFTRVNEATARVLEANNYCVEVPSRQVCCGALHAHAGDLEGARRLARQNVDAFASHDEAPIITNAGGCGAMLVTYAHLLAGDEAIAEQARSFSARVRDVSQQLETSNPKAGAPLDKAPITYDASCHLIYGQHVGDAPLRMLRAIPELRLVPLADSEKCCGGAGVYNLIERDLSRAVLAEKLAAIKATGAGILVTGNAGCQMQIGAGALLEDVPLRVCHPVELLDESYRNAGMYDAKAEG